MKYYIKHESNGRITSQILKEYFESSLTDEQKAQYSTLVLVDFPDPENIMGKGAIPYYNSTTNEIFYEYVDLPKPPPTVGELQAENDVLGQQLFDLQTQLIMKGVI